MNISEIANRHGIYNIGPHDKGWKGGKDRNYSLGNPLDYAELVTERLELQMFKENFDPKAQFFINRPSPTTATAGFAISGEAAVMAEVQFLRTWYKATEGMPASAEVTFNSGPDPLKNKFWTSRLRPAGTAPRFDVTILEPGKAPVVKAGVTLTSVKLPKDSIVTVRAMVMDPTVGKLVPYTHFWCPAFAGKANHLEWWHFQPRTFNGQPLGTPAAPKWVDLVRDIGITEEMVRELYAAPVLTKKATLVE